jgi:2-aminoadipate transaminase
MLATMTETFPDHVRWTEPEGGLFTWLTFPTGFDAAAFMTERLLPEAKVAFVPGATFFPVHQQPQHARMSFSGVADDRLVQGVTAIGTLLRQV